MRDIETTQTRYSWDDYFIQMANVVSIRSTCDRLHVGAVLTYKNNVIGTGYNGSISGHEHCNGDNHLIYENGCKRTIHAEMNILMYCARSGIPTEGCTMYVTHQPCPDCTKHMNQAGIKKVIYQHPYKHRYENNFDDGMDVIHHTTDTIVDLTASRLIR